MAKVRVQAHGSASEKVEGKPHVPKYSGAVDVLKKVYKSEGLVGWYQVRHSALPHSIESLCFLQGMGAQILKAVLAQAFLFMSKDQFEHYALVIMIVWQRLITASPM